MITQIRRIIRCILIIALSFHSIFKLFLQHDEFDRTFILLFGSTADLDENTSVSVAYHDQREPVHGHHAEEGVRNFVHVRRECVECYTLGVTGVIRMLLEMEHQHLRTLMPVAEEEERKRERERERETSGIILRYYTDDGQTCKLAYLWQGAKHGADPRQYQHYPSPPVNVQDLKGPHHCIIPKT